MHPKVEEATATVATGTAAGLGKVSDGHVPDLVPRYYERLRLDPASLDPEPTVEKLCRLQEAHLAQILFENIAQHRNEPRRGRLRCCMFRSFTTRNRNNSIRGV
jgi:hypothetical protein